MDFYSKLLATLHLNYSFKDAFCCCLLTLENFKYCLQNVHIFNPINLK